MAPRPVCYRCHKPRQVCICDRIRTVANRTPILIIQHGRERNHPLGTARIARLALENLEMRVSWYEPPLEPPESMELPWGAALLYPSREARDLAEIPPEERPGSLVVLDGTWRHVRSLYRTHEFLQDLPKVRIRTDRPSRYRLRKGPGPGYLSTIEAIVLALEILEPDTPGIQGLLDTFDEMIDEQMEYTDRDTPRYLRRRPPSDSD